jgi:hypothetical protein
MANITDSSQSQGLLHPSTGHGYRDSEGLQSTHQNVYDAPQLCDSASEGLQSVDHDGRNGPQVVEQYPMSPNLKYAHSGHAEYDKSQPLVSNRHPASTPPRGRRRLLWAILIAVAVAIAIAIGVGAGVGLSRQSSKSDGNTNEQQGSSEEYVSFLKHCCCDIPSQLTESSMLYPPPHPVRTFRQEPFLHQHHQPHPRSRQVPRLAWPPSAATTSLR